MPSEFQDLLAAQIASGAITLDKAAQIGSLVLSGSLDANSATIRLQALQPSDTVSPAPPSKL
jgi:hypothetical protein